MENTWGNKSIDWSLKGSHVFFQSYKSLLWRQRYYLLFKTLNVYNLNQRKIILHEDVCHHNLRSGKFYWLSSQNFVMVKQNSCVSFRMVVYFKS